MSFEYNPDVLDMGEVSARVKNLENQMQQDRHSFRRWIIAFLLLLGTFIFGMFIIMYLLITGV